MAALRESFHIAATPEQVLARIGARAGVWRESQVPAELASLGVLGVEVIRNPTYFELRAHPWHRDPPPTEYRFLGTVQPTASGAVVHVQVTASPVARLGPRGWVLLAVVGAGTLYVLGWTALVFAAVTVAVALGRDSTLTRGADPIVEWYFDLLRRALDVPFDSADRAG